MPRVTKAQRIAQFAADRGWTILHEAEWAELSLAFPRVTAKTVESAGLLPDQPWRGVKQQNFDELEQSLLDLAAVYSSRADLRALARAKVIEAKEHARFASRSQLVTEERRRAKAEMAEWMLVWLDNPEIFAVWAERRRAVLARDDSRDPDSRDLDLQGLDLQDDALIANAPGDVPAVQMFEEGDSVLP